MNRMAKMLGVLLLAGASFLAGGALADQPKMQAALDHLQAARDALEQATHDKGGHRKQALELVNEAIEHVRKGIGHDRKN
jgi:hypothetical protein